MKNQKPAPKNGVAKEARRVKIAKALIAQKSPSQIASDLGIVRRTVHREIAEPETQQLIRQWMQPHYDSVKAMIPEAIGAVRDGLNPEQETRDRLQAVKTLGTVMGWCQGETDGDGSAGRAGGVRFAGTLEELLVEYRRITTQDGTGREA